MDGFHRYCRQMADMNEEEFSHTVLGVIHGETRVLAANMVPFNDNFTMCRVFVHFLCLTKTILHGLIQPRKSII